MRKQKRTQCSNTIRPGILPRITTQSISDRFAGKVNTRQVQSAQVLLERSSVCLSFCLLVVQSVLAFWLTRFQQLRDDEDATMAQITYGNYHLQRLWSLSKGSQRFPPNNFQAVLRHAPRHACWTKKKYIACCGAVVHISAQCTIIGPIPSA